MSNNKIQTILGLILIIVAATALAGCQGKALGKPKIKDISHNWGEVTQDTTEINTEVGVHNPNPVGLPFKQIRFDLYMNGIPMASGSSKKGLKIKADQTTTISLTSQLDNDKIPEWWVSHLRNDEVTEVKIDGGIVFDLKITEFTYPLEKTKKIKTNLLRPLNTEKDQELNVGPISLTLKSLTSSWGQITEKTSYINHRAVIHNPNPYPIPVTRIDYTIRMNDIKVGKGTTHNPAVIEAKSDTTIPFTTKIDNNKLDEWWIRHIKNGEKTTLVLTIKPTIEIQDKKVQFTLAKKEKTFETHILE